MLLADPAPVGLSQAGYTDEAIGPNEARMIAMNERLVKERDELRAEVDRLSAAPVGLTEDERELVDRVLANEEDPEYEKSAIIDIFAAEALHKVFDGPTVQEIRHARYVMAKRASDMVSDRFRLAQALDRLSAAPVDDREREGEVLLDGKPYRVECVGWSMTGPDEPHPDHFHRLVPVSPSVDPEEEP